MDALNFWKYLSADPARRLTDRFDLQASFHSEFPEYLSKAGLPPPSATFSQVLYALSRTGKLHVVNGVTIVYGQPTAAGADEHRGVDVSSEPVARARHPASANQSKNRPARVRTARAAKAGRARASGAAAAGKGVVLAVDQHVVERRRQEQLRELERLRGERQAQEEPEVLSNLPPEIQKMYQALLGSAGKESRHRCEICKITCSSEKQYNEHLDGRQHVARAQASRLSTQRAAWEADKNGVAVTPLPVAFGVVQIGERKTIDLVVHNTDNPACNLIRVGFLHPVREFSLEDKYNVVDGMSDDFLVIPAGTSYTVRMHCEPANLGALRTIVAFNFGDFRILRYVECLVEDREMSALLAPVAPYKPPPVVSKQQPVATVPGEPPERPATTPFRRTLKTYAVPNWLRHALNSGEMTELDALVTRPLTAESYAAALSALLWVEEIQMEVDIRKYDMDNAQMSHTSHLLRLAVPGLAEKRPTVLAGDRVYVRLNGDTIEYEGYAHAVERDAVLLRFASAFHNGKYKDGMLLHCRFTFGRTPLRRAHQALELLPAEEGVLLRMLFPSPQLEPADDFREQKLAWYNTALNERQRQAVENIFAGYKFSHAGPDQLSDICLPYIIFGPPGTGKTITIVESIKQIWGHKPGSTILACAPSNTAADLLVERLLQHVPSKDILRLNAYQRTHATVPSTVLPCSLYSERARAFTLPTLDDLLRYRIVVATCTTAGVMHSMGVPAGHFSHVFVDEAGHADEPECIIPLAGFVSERTQVILAGDPQQLGPVIRSPIAQKYGLDISLLGRLIEQCQFYKRIDDEDFSEFGYYNPLLITKLVKNYRSHPAILRLPSAMFYDGELQPVADRAIIEKLLGWDRLPNRAFPLLFHGVVGLDQRESHSPSWFNAAEVQLVVQYIESLQTFPVPLTDIGVVTPYRKQVQKLRSLFAVRNLSDVRVGTVEDFQGQERLVMIVTTVRSSHEFVEFDFAHNLGFVKNPKRFNVAVTRAQALLIVVGNPFVLSHDPHWEFLLKYCLANKAYTGCPFSSDFEGDDEEDLLRQMDTFQLTDDTLADDRTVDDGGTEAAWSAEALAGPRAEL